MNRHRPGTIIWTLDRLVRLYQDYKRRFGDRMPEDIQAEQLASFRGEWAAQVSRESGHAVTTNAVDNQLRWGFTTQQRISRNHVWVFLSNQTARLHVGLCVGSKFRHSWPEALEATYVTAP